ncbi:Asp-tRNA(Asn)/Glu-tRNA(Gln) amidotransferase subunit GatC [Pontibacter sp. FD36]|uniref:Aspartyl/glutamyl-tRNA(Asn/Gln) amidotransferase subunit C n=2 Tax=Pontibacter TaxID=323449 RepID=A0A1N6TBN7_9BACT|nr:MULTISPECIES: Asp-tRNA(Asn)/Glu-tRNA(Gln) amidotransferase subunit GatC [Pontibacter]EJF11101.1 aspartyl/glutamyl-tRNA(Asn/Gln) amidotransferase subunit C [Pontibacter sp. BAB1700]MBF8961871.1 Asp-tRNA(Asn)/Glu-tRNA(Gln) amidotransferase subunit GatC [Pontibacter sp. FD36]SIQ50782.1 aspartyl/glutamyl-tRNA(Asn/Gln) amidotransferase subunit C [Pontibacter lucknowensis]SIT92165.1 aspartyl/glutamyl-tRNA(Asn/Gln) amidotransferase subunit C [Pontibacter indicus]
MSTDIQTIRKIAHLARLEFNEEKEQEMLQDLNKILNWVDQLRELDTESVEPLIHMSEEVNVMREDLAQNTVSHDEALKNAPRKDSDYFRVPKVLE